MMGNEDNEDNDINEGNEVNEDNEDNEDNDINEETSRSAELKQCLQSLVDAKEYIETSHKFQTYAVCQYAVPILLCPHYQMSLPYSILDFEMKTFIVKDVLANVLVGTKKETESYTIGLFAEFMKRVFDNDRRLVETLEPYLEKLQVYLSVHSGHEDLKDMIKQITEHTEISHEVLPPYSNHVNDEEYKSVGDKYQDMFKNRHMVEVGPRELLEFSSSRT